MSFQFEKLTAKAQEAVANAQQAATQAGNPEITVMHLLNALLADPDGIVRSLLQKTGVPVEQLISMVRSETEKLPTASGGNQPGIAAGLKSVLDQAAALAAKMGDEFVSTEHLILALTEIDSPAKRILKMNAVEKQDLEQALQKVRGSQRVTDQHPEGKYEALEKY